MDEIRTTAEAKVQARRRLRAARALLEGARADARAAEEVLYGHAPRSWRATRRIEDAIEAASERMGELAEAAPDQADEPVDLDDAPSWVCSDCGARACHQVGPRRYCEPCLASHLDVSGPDEPVDLASPPR